MLKTCICLVKNCKLSLTESIFKGYLPSAQYLRQLYDFQSYLDSFDSQNHITRRLIGTN